MGSFGPLRVYAITAPLQSLEEIRFSLLLLSFIPWVHFIPAIHSKVKGFSPKNIFSQERASQFLSFSFIHSPFYHVICLDQSCYVACVSHRSKTFSI